MLVVSLRRTRSPQARECGRVALVTGVIALFVASCQGASEGPAGELEARLHAGDRQRFGFVYRAGGTAVLDCMLPNRQFHVTVDAALGAVEVRRGSATGSPLAVSLPDAVLVHRSAFEGPSIATEWIAAPGQPGTQTPEVVTAALGVDVASYVVSPGLPEDGAGMVSSLLESAASVTQLDTSPDDLTGVDGYRLELPADVEPSLPGAGDVVADVWVDRDDTVRRVRVFEPGADTAGWTLDFTEPAQALDISPTAVTEIDDVPSLRPAPIPGCRLG